MQCQMIQVDKVQVSLTHVDTVELLIAEFQHREVAKQDCSLPSAIFGDWCSIPRSIDEGVRFLVVDRVPNEKAVAPEMPLRPSEIRKEVPDDFESLAPNVRMRFRNVGGWNTHVVEPAWQWRIMFDDGLE